MFKSSLSLFILLFLQVSVNAQTRIGNTGYTAFQVSVQSQLVEFMVADTQFTQTKPVLLFCQGSQPIPLVIDFGANQLYPIPLNNFQIDSLRKHFYPVVISKPYTPLVAAQQQLNPQYQYITNPSNPHSYDTNYLRADNLGNYVKRANAVITYLLQQNWVAKNQLVLAGHSQGAREAVAIAAQNNLVTHLGLFGYDFRPRINQNIQRVIRQEQTQQITALQADSLMQQEYDFYAMALNHDSVAHYPELVSWQSFSVNQLPTLLEINIPIYLANGSADYGAQSANLLPLRFAEAHKNNLIFKRYAGLEHNFFPVDTNGQPNRQNGQWAMVMNSFLEWTLR